MLMNAEPRELENPKGSPKVTVVICALNEASNLSAVLPRIPDWIDEVLLVDGNSTDDTVEIAKVLRPELRVLFQPKPGKDAALSFGVQHASGDIIVALDSDGEAAPEEITRFIEPLLNGYDFVKGSRFTLGWGNKPLARILGNWLIVKTCNAIYGTRFTDLCSGFNAFWKRRTEDANLWHHSGWNYEPRIVARALVAGLKVTEVPQHYEGRLSGESKLPDWRQGLNSLWFLVLERLHPLRRQ
jgi:glycosyltransferase involved in cell wall biosynthesis